MNKTIEKISANEINRYMYCPYQWYYKRHYGNAFLQNEYKALGITSSKHTNNFVKGTKYHTQYHYRYHLKRLIQCIALLILIALILNKVIT
ncbi:MAG: hypothetical protein ACRCSG_09580 [Cellulosilyticaceae bacterium]